MEKARVFAPSVIVVLVTVGIGVFFIREIALEKIAHSDELPGEPTLAKSVAFEAPTDESQFHVPPPPLEKSNTPCTRCHYDLVRPTLPDGADDEARAEYEEALADYREEVADRQEDLERRALDHHKEIVLHHDEANRWCLDCHDPLRRDFVHLADGRLVPLAESYKLCGQCHGNVFRDWKQGLHGKRTGQWNGEKQYLLCVHCHDPHAPAFRPINPFPPPAPPHVIK